ncbi:EAL domain-containing protein [Shewanella submarina]|uniref:EAL domain-containing protein n=1 Tax=Shewanella submarina TaxID=2016376 RepID=A0ABV7GE46_9GAMM|nr:EAL domain-containing protein [Shewanella submarina]MCL1039946.1 EAL domain-containing protein [Shewanella submarina]
MPNRKAINTLLSLLLFIVSGSVQALSPSPYPIKLNAKSYGLEEGLSQIAVSSITEDHNGYVWVGTLNGLNRYNGQKFRHYFAEDGSDLPSSFIRRLFTDSQGRVFVGTDRGLVVYESRYDRFYLPENLKALLANRSISSISEFPEGLIVSSTKEIFKLSKDLSSIERVYSTSKIEIKKVVYLNGEMYIHGYDNSLIQVGQAGEIEVSGVIDVITLGEKLFILKNAGYEVIGKNSNKTVHDASISYITSSSKLDYIIALEQGSLIKLDSELNKEYLGTLWSEDLDISGLQVSDDAVRVLTYNRGYYETSDKINIISNIPNIEHYVWDIKAFGNDKIIIATEGARLLVLNSNYEEIDNIDASVSGPKKLYVDGSDIFFTSRQGLFKVDTTSGSSVNILNGAFWSITGDERQLILGSDNGVLHTYDKTTQSSTSIHVESNNEPVLDVIITSDDKDAYWIGTQGGLYLYKDQNLKKVKSGIVFSLFQDQDDIFIGSSKGLSKVDKKEMSIDDIIINNKPVYSITELNDVIYATSDKEIISYNKDSNQILLLTRSFGSNDEYNQQSVEIIGNTALFGAKSGIATLNDEKLDEFINNSSAPKITLDSLKIFNKEEIIGGDYLSESLNETNVLTLKYSDYPLTISFSSPGNEDVDIFYQLKGLSDTFVQAIDINAATYTNLSSGDYTLNVYAMDKLTKKVSNMKSLNLVVTPPWWLSTEAKLVYLVIAALIAAAIIKALIRRREVQKKIAQSEERLKLSLWGSGDEMWDWDIESGQIYRSNIWGSLDFPKDGQRAGEPGEESNIHPFDQSRVRDALKSHFNGETEHFEAAYRVKGKGGDWIWILDRAKIVERDEQDRAVRMTGTIKNISNFKQTEEQLKLFERAIRNMSEGMFILDDSFSFVAVNQACCQLSHQSRDKFIGREMNFELYPENYSTQVKQLLLKHGRWHADVEAKRGDGTSFLMELTIDAIYGEAGVISHYVGVFSDITRRKSQEEELRKLTNNDGLTGLPNRSNMQVTLSNLVKKDSHHTLMVIDLDNFKKINDSLGHQIGDELLVLVAKRLEQAIPRHTGLYRLGGDEFAILEDKLPDIGSGATIASRIIEHFATPFEIAGEKLVIGLSIGIVLYPEDEQNEQALLRKADIAMYHAKSAGGNRYQFYSESLNKNAIRQLEIENLIRDGLRKDFFQVHYQPKYDIKSNKLTGMEALVRLDHPDKGLISPGEFIPLAEENGLIVEIGDLVLKKACFAAQSWREQGLFNGRVAVNLSSHQFALPDLQQRIESILALTRLPAANLELEITEGTVIKQPEKAIKVMQQLSKMGVSLALDDFGTGYSSLSYLKRFPINTLKIDKAFVDDIDKSDRDLKMVDSIITIAHNMGLSVVGEGVELSAQLSLLKALNCEEIQGFLYSKALPENEFTALLEQQRQNNHSAVS